MKDIEPAETELVKKLVTGNMICLDIGANEGYFTTLMAKQCKYVYSFEAEPRNYAILSANCHEQKLDNVTARSVIVSDNDGWGKLYLCIGDYNGADGMHRIYPSKWCSDIAISVPSITIDKYLECAAIDFIKMDIEGSELGALKGMQRMLEKDRPLLLMEFHPPSIEEYGSDPRDVYDFMINLNYDIRLGPHWNTPISFENLMKETMKEPSGRNVFCRWKG